MASGGPSTSGPTATTLRRFGLLLSIAMMLGGLGIQLERPPFLETVQNAVFDSYQRVWPRTYQPSPVRIVDIDEETLARLGQWPWPRTRVAEMVSRIRAAGASAIAFDILFAESDRTSPGHLAEDWGLAKNERRVLSKLPDHDEFFAKEIARGNVVTAFALSNDAATDQAPVAVAKLVRMGDQGPLSLRNYSGAIVTLPDLTDRAAGNGSITVSPSGDGVVREVPLLIDHRGTPYPALTIEALRVAVGKPNLLVEAIPPRNEGGAAQMTGLRIGPLVIPTNPNGLARVYLTKPVEERYIPAWKVLDGSADDLLPPGAIVFVGSSATGLKDLRVGPLGKVLPGVEIHAQLVEQIIHGVHVRRPSWAMGTEMLIALLSWVAMLILGAKNRPTALAMAVMLGLASEIVIGVYYWNFEKQLIDPLTPGLIIVASFFSYVIPRQVAAEREQRWVRDAFANYMSPNLVDHLIDHPDELRLGGERRECSFVLTDVADFTRLVETSDPAALTDVINEYLDGMVRIAFKHGGTLDRIVGDAVAVIFSAPVTQKDHPSRAIRCGVEMDEFARAYSQACQARGVPFGQTRIGVHTGEVVIGNFGGSLHFDYRPLGDPINTAARLETVNRQIGTTVCVSEATAGRCEDFVGRKVGALVLKGKTEPLVALEPCSQDQADSEALRAYSEAFELLEEDPERAELAFAKVLELDPEDGLAQFHLDRLKAGKRGQLIVFGEK